MPAVMNACSEPRCCHGTEQQDRSKDLDTVFVPDLTDYEQNLAYKKKKIEILGSIGLAVRSNDG